MIKHLIVLFIMISSAGLNAQPLEDYLKQVATGNPEIISFRKLLEARSYEARTGNTPPDPFISGGILPGTGDPAGSKKMWSFTQSFAFPSKYLQQKKINRNTIRLAEQEFRQGKMQILLYAKMDYIDLLYKTRYLNKLEARRAGYERLQSAWKKMLENGQSTIMEYNRIMLGITANNLQISRTKSEISILAEKLAFAAGGRVNVVEASAYPLDPLADPESLIVQKEGVHPAYLIPAIEHEIALQEVSLTRAGALPEFELGYQSEATPGETYTGPVGGISIPLWSNSGKVRAAAARAEHSETQKIAGIQRLNLELRNEFSATMALQQSMDEIRKILETGGGTKYLDIALEAGELTITTYFNYIETIYESEDRLMELESEYHKSVAILLDHELLSL